MNRDPILNALMSLALVGLLCNCQSVTVSRTAASDAASLPTRSGTVVSTGDGDTLRVQPVDSTTPITVRIGCIDAPETSQAGGEWSASQLAQLLPVGSLVEIAVLDVDRYGRTVAELWKSGRSINLELVKLGAAVVYPQYLNQCADPAGIEAAQASAQSQRIGFWSLPLEQQIMPWDWRN